MNGCGQATCLNSNQRGGEDYPVCFVGVFIVDVRPCARDKRGAVIGIGEDERGEFVGSVHVLRALYLSLYCREFLTNSCRHHWFRLSRR